MLLIFVCFSPPNSLVDCYTRCEGALSQCQSTQTLCRLWRIANDSIGSIGFDRFLSRSASARLLVHTTGPVDTYGFSNSSRSLVTLALWRASGSSIRDTRRCIFEKFRTFCGWWNVARSSEFYNTATLFKHCSSIVEHCGAQRTCRSPADRGPL